MKISKLELSYFMQTDRRRDKTNPIFVFAILLSRLTIRTTVRLFKFCVAEIRLCVLQTAAVYLQSLDCDTEWLIGINVANGGVCVEKKS